MWWDVAKTDSCPKNRKFLTRMPRFPLSYLIFVVCSLLLVCFLFFLFYLFDGNEKLECTGVNLDEKCFVSYVIQLKDQSHIKHLDVGNGKCWHTFQTWNIIELNWFSSEKDRKQVEKESRHLPWDEAGQRETISSRKISNDLSLFATIRILLNAISLDQVIQ